MLPYLHAHAHLEAHPADAVGPCPHQRRATALRNMHEVGTSGTCGHERDKAQAQGTYHACVAFECCQIRQITHDTYAVDRVVVSYNVTIYIFIQTQTICQCTMESKP